MNQVTSHDFKKIELRAGTIIQVDDFPEVKKPSYKVWVDFGPKLGVKKTSAQVTTLYTKEWLLQQQVICVTNLPAKQIGPIMSECLVTGFILENGDVVLNQPQQKVPNGTRLA